MTKDDQLSSVTNNSSRTETINGDNSNVGGDLKARLTECQCPKCGIGHFIKMRWVGTGVPRKFCLRCKSKIDGYVERNCQGGYLTSLFDADRIEFSRF